jgi:hypothetical protein
MIASTVRMRRTIVMPGVWEPASVLESLIPTGVAWRFFGCSLNRITWGCFWR